MDAEKYGRMTSSPLFVRRSTIVDTVSYLAGRSDSERAAIAELLNSPPLEKPDKHEGDASTDFFDTSSLSRDDAYMASAYLGGAEYAALDESENPTPESAIIASLADEWRQRSLIDPIASIMDLEQGGEGRVELEEEEVEEDCDGPQMSPILKSILGEREELIGPIIIRGTQIAAYRVSSSPSKSHFGGCLLEGLKKPEGAVIHSVATIDTESSPIFEGFDHPFVHLLYAFRHDWSGLAGLEYTHRPKGIKITKLREKHSDPYWPYEEFPDVLPRLYLECIGTIEVDDDAIGMLLTQDVGHDDPEKIIGVVPPSPDYGVSLWGDGDDEGVQCIFEISIKSGEVKTYNICS